MSDQSLIIIDYGKREVSFTDRADEAERLALRRSVLIGSVDNADQQNVAVEAQREISAAIKLFESAYRACKDPLWELCKKLDNLFRSKKAELEGEQMRLAKLVGDFQALEQAKVRAAEAARKLEEERIERERLADERRIREDAAAAQRKLDEERRRIEAVAREARNESERKIAEIRALELKRQQELATAKSHDDLGRINDDASRAAANLPVVQAARSEGQVVKQEWLFEVTDLWTLARAHPTCVKIEPRPGEIKSLLAAGAKLSGIRAWQETKSSVRAAKNPLSIEV